MSYSDFYDPYRVTLPFWAWGKDYTIVPNRHIGIDIGRWGGKTATVPALASGRVVRVRWTKAMGMCVVLQVGDRFHAYCHLANDDLPRWGTDLKRGERVGRLAVGSRSESAIDFPGTAWGGIHLHLVVTNHADAAYTYPRVRGSEFYDPAITIANALAQAAGGDNSRPFEPEEDMTQADVDYLKKAVDNLSTVVGAISNAIADENIGILKNASDAAGRSADAVAISKNVEAIVAGVQNAIADPNIGILVASNDARAAATATLDAVGKISRGESNIDVAALATQIRQGLGADLAAELAKRLSN